MAIPMQMHVVFERDAERFDWPDNTVLIETTDRQHGNPAYVVAHAFSIDEMVAMVPVGVYWGDEFVEMPAERITESYNDPCGV